MFYIIWMLNFFIFDPLWWLWSQCVNRWLWWTCYRGAWDAARNEMMYIRDRTKTLDDVRRELKTFHWIEDSFKDWFPWIETFIASGMHDDCDGAAVFGGWLLANIGKKSRRVKLISTNFSIWRFWKYYYHIIQVTKDNKFFVSNNDLVEITGTDWKGFIKDYFGKQLQFYDWIL